MLTDDNPNNDMEICNILEPHLVKKLLLTNLMTLKRFSSVNILINTLFD